MYEKILTVPEPGWRTAELFHELQDVSGDAVAEVHATGADLKKIGLMWVVVRYDVSLSRPLKPEEKLQCLTWANPFRHRMSQRNYLIRDEAGEPVLTGAGIWAVADRESRTMIEPDSYGIVFETEVTGAEHPRPAVPEKLPFVGEREYRVTESDLDMNGHMNNTRFFTLAEQCMGEETDLPALRRARVLYANEALKGEALAVRWGTDRGHWYFTGEGRGKNCFQMDLDYFSGS